MEDGRGATEVWVPAWHRGSGTRWACGDARGSDGWQGPREEPRPAARPGPRLWVLHSLFALPAQRDQGGGGRWWWRAWCWGASPGHVLRSRRAVPQVPACSSASCSAPHLPLRAQRDWYLLRIGSHGLVSAQWPLSTKCPEVDDVNFHGQLVHS